MLFFTEKRGNETLIYKACNFFCGSVNVDPLSIDFVFTFLANLLPFQTKFTIIFHFPYSTPCRQSKFLHPHICHKAQHFVFSNFLTNIVPFNIHLIRLNFCGSFTTSSNLFSFLPPHLELRNFWHPPSHICHKTQNFEQFHSEYSPTQN